MEQANVSDLRVKPASIGGEDGYLISSSLTRGACANVVAGPEKGEWLVMPLFTPSYMAGISVSLIRRAVEEFVAQQDAACFQV